MVQLTITKAINDAITLFGELGEDSGLPIPDSIAVGEPISHGQILELWQGLRAKGETKYTLEDLLRGSRVYIPPPPPKPEPVSPLGICYDLHVD